MEHKCLSTLFTRESGTPSDASYFKHYGSESVASLSFFPRIASVFGLTVAFFSDATVCFFEL